MMDFILVPLIFGIVTFGIYKLFELFVCRRERLSIIEKLGDKITSPIIVENLKLPVYNQSKFSFGALKAGALLIGIGLGLLIGYLICNLTMPDYSSGNGWSSHSLRQISSVIYGSCVLLFGGTGLIIAFITEIKLTKSKDQ